MNRKLVSQEKLLEWMNKELAKHEDCEDCRFIGVMGLQDKDSDGCNWSPGYIRCRGVSSEICKPFASRVTAEAQKRFNLLRD